MGSNKYTAALMRIPLLGQQVIQVLEKVSPESNRWSRNMQVFCMSCVVPTSPGAPVDVSVLEIAQALQAVSGLCLLKKEVTREPH